MSDTICEWCGLKIADDYLAGRELCHRCATIGQHSLVLAQQVAKVTQKGGCQLYIAVERIGQDTQIVAAKRWSPLESLDAYCKPTI